jgi:hypothetical protein
VLRSPRLAFAAAAGFALIAGATCADSSLTGPVSSGLRAFVGLAPAFTKAAADIYRGLVAFQLEIDNIHVKLKHANGTIAKDTVVALAAGADSVAIELQVQLETAEELMEAFIELRDGDQVLFSGNQQVRARRGLPAEASPPIPIVYIGPGSSATDLTLSPADTTILSTDSVVYRASATDANGQPVTNLAIDWSVKSAGAGTVSIAGVFKPTQLRGSTYVIARLPTGVRDSAFLSFVAVPTQLALISGGGQAGIVGSALPQPIVVETRAADNVPVPGVSVSFAVTSGGGIVTPPVAVTDANGRASATLTLGNAAGANAVQVTLAGRPPIVVNATGNPAAPGQLQALTAPSAAAMAGVTLGQQPVIQVLDTFGNAITATGLHVNASVLGEGYSLGGTTTATTDATGKATFSNLDIRGPIGPAALRFTLGETGVQLTSGTITVAPGHARVLAMAQQPSGSAVLGAPLLTQPHVHLHDGFGNDVAAGGIPVTASLIVADEGRTLAGTLTVNTNAAGLAEFSNLAIGGTPGTTRLVFSGPDSLAVATSNEITTAAGVAATLLAVNTLASGDTAGANAAAALLPAVSVRDANNNPVPGVEVKFRRHGGVGSSINAQPDTLVLATTGTNGVASLNARRLQTAIGLDTVLVTAAGLTDTLRFVAAVTNAVASQLQWIAQPANGVGGAALAPVVVQLFDQFGNPAVAGASSTSAVTVGLSGGTAGALLGGTTTQSASGGVATFNLSVNIAGTGYRLSAGTATIAAVASATFDVAPGAAALLAIVSGNDQGSLAAELLAQQLVIRATDLGGNPIEGALVRFVVDSGGGAFADATSDTVVAADANGLAAVNWYVGAGQQRVSATLDGAGATAVFRAYVAERLVLVTPPSLNPQSGQPLAQQPVVRLVDNAGHLVRRSGVLVRAELVREAPFVDVFMELFGDRSATTDAEGVATFSTLQVEGDLSQLVHLEFYRTIDSQTEDTGIARATTGTMTLRPGTAVDILPDGSEFHLLNAAGTQTVSVRVTDGNNSVPNSPVNFQLLAGQTANCQLSGTSATTNAAGVASINVTVAGSLISCIVAGQMATGGVEAPQVFHRVVVAPSGMAVWTGAADQSWNDSRNWLGAMPGATADVFVPTAAIVSHLPNIASSEQLRSLRIETGASVGLDRATLSVRDSLGADGLVNGVLATVVMNGAGGAVRGNFSQSALVIDVDGITGACNPATPYVVNGTLFTDTDLRVNCALSVANAAAGVVVTGNLDIASGAAVAHTAGAVNVQGSTTIGGQLGVGSTASFATMGDFVVAPNTGRFVHAGGDVFVQGNATFDGFADLRSGTFSLNRNFAHTGNGDNNRLAGAPPHVTRFVGDATEPRQLFWDSPPGGTTPSTFGQLEFITTGSGGINTASGTIGSHIRSSHTIVRRDALFAITDGRHALTTGGVVGQGLIVETGGRVINQGTINVPFSVGCLLTGIITGSFSCLTVAQ